jgi:hypothetical protein
MKPLRRPLSLDAALSLNAPLAPRKPRRHSTSSLPSDGLHSCKHCQDICLDTRPSTQSKHAAILLGTTPANAAARLETEYSSGLAFIPMTEETIDEGLAARCRLFTLLGDEHRRRQDPTTSMASQIFLVARITDHIISFDYLRSLPTRLNFRSSYELLASRGMQN